MKKLYYLLILFVVTIGACKKETGIGADLLPGNDLLFAKNVDTFTLYTKTIADTALRSDKLSKVYLGVLNDPIFGFQKSSFAIELDRGDIIYDDTLRPVSGYTVDSVLLFLKFNGIYGDSLVAQDFNVSVLSSPINESSVYYSNNTTFTPTTLLGNVTNYKFVPTRTTSLTATDTAGTAQIFRVPLNSSYFQNLLNNNTASQLRDSLNFKTNILPGLFIENSSSSGNAMIEMDLSSAFSCVTIFYKDKYAKQHAMKLKTSQLANISGTLASRQNGINFFNATFSPAMQNVVSSGLASDSVNYILGQGGSLVKLSLPTIGNLGKVAVNKAVLSVTQIISNTTKDFYTPYPLIVLKRNSSGILDILPTYSTLLNYAEGASLPDSVGTDGSGNKIVRYNLNITKYIQALSLGTQDNSDLYLGTYRSGGTNGTVNAMNTTALNISNYVPYRAVVAGSTYSDARYKMKLNIIYTLLK
ncbi:MAG: DUF4270 family protein [Chitinophagales bacterium]